MHDTLVYKDYRVSVAAVSNCVAVLQKAGYPVSLEQYQVVWRQAIQIARQDSGELGEVSFDRWYQIIFNGLGILEYGPDLVMAVNQAWNDSFASATFALPQTKASLRRLRAGYALGIVSNSLAPNTVMDLRVAGLLDFFGAVVISSDIGKRKPHPVIFSTALEKLGLHPAEAVFVGDNLYEDIYGASQLGMKTVLIEHPLIKQAQRQRAGYAIPRVDVTVEPGARIHGLKELATVLEKWTRHGSQT